jgi:hypothetical protein
LENRLFHLFGFSRAVPLANAHASGGWNWTTARKQAYANDRTSWEHLIGVSLSANRAKGSSGPEDWKVPSLSFLIARPSI